MKNAVYLASTQETERWVPLIQNCSGVNLFVCCVAEAMRVVSGDNEYMRTFLQTNRLSSSHARTQFNTEKKIFSTVSECMHGGCLGSGVEKRSRRNL